MHSDPRLASPNGALNVFLFGSLPLSFDHSEFHRIQSTVRGDESVSWILKVVSELPELWQPISAALGVPSERVVEGYMQLVDLKNAFNSGAALTTPYPLPNKLLVPLATIDQLIQYMSFHKNAYASQDGEADWVSRASAKGETLGFCTGLLSSAAVSSSKSPSDFERYGSSAIRLAVAVGAVADMDAKASAQSPQPTRCLGTEWNSDSKLTDLRKIIDSRDDVSAPILTRIKQVITITMGPILTIVDIHLCQLRLQPRHGYYIVGGDGSSAAKYEISRIASFGDRFAWSISFRRARGRSQRPSPILRRPPRIPVPRLF